MSISLRFAGLLFELLLFPAVRCELLDVVDATPLRSAGLGGLACARGKETKNRSFLPPPPPIVGVFLADSPLSFFELIPVSLLAARCAVVLEVAESALVELKARAGDERALLEETEKRENQPRRSIVPRRSSLSLFDLFLQLTTPLIFPTPLPPPFPLQGSTVEIAEGTRIIENKHQPTTNQATMQGQDWNPIILSKKRSTTKDATSSKAVNAALRSGAAVETLKKFSAGTNKSGAGPLKDAAKLDRETEELSHER